MIWTRTNILIIVALALVEAINVASSWGDPLEIVRLTAYLVVSFFFGRWVSRNLG